MAETHILRIPPGIPPHTRISPPTTADSSPQLQHGSLQRCVHRIALRAHPDPPSPPHKRCRRNLSVRQTAVLQVRTSPEGGKTLRLRKTGPQARSRPEWQAARPATRPPSCGCISSARRHPPLCISRCYSRMNSCSAPGASSSERVCAASLTGVSSPVFTSSADTA